MRLYIATREDSSRSRWIKKGKGDESQGLPIKGGIRYTLLTLGYNIKLA
jgi:hypothetical protein